MKKFLISSFAMATLALSTSCSPFQVRTDYAVSADFTAYKTYKLRIDDLKLNDIDKDRVLNEVSKQLQLKGLSVGDSPDLIVNVKAEHKHITDVQRTSPYGAWGWGSAGWGFGFGIERSWASEHNTGSLIIDLIDAQSQKLNWQGIGSGLSVDSPKRKQKEIPALVFEMMKTYPPQAK